MIFHRRDGLWDCPSFNYFLILREKLSLMMWLKAFALQWTNTNDLEVCRSMKISLFGVRRTVFDVQQSAISYDIDVTVPDHVLLPRS